MTGDAALDDAIVGFVERDVYFDDIDFEQDADTLLLDRAAAGEEGMIHTLCLMREPEIAVGMCMILASRFAEYARVHHNLDACSSEDVYGNACTPADGYWRYDLHLPGGAESSHRDLVRGHHVVTFVMRDRSLWLVDFTAAQFELEGFPLVTRCVASDLDELARTLRPPTINASEAVVHQPQATLS